MLTDPLTLFALVTDLPLVLRPSQPLASDDCLNLLTGFDTSLYVTINPPNVFLSSDSLVLLRSEWRIIRLRFDRNGRFGCVRLRSYFTAGRSGI